MCKLISELLDSSKSQIILIIWDLYIKMCVTYWAINTMSPKNQLLTGTR